MLAANDVDGLQLKPLPKSLSALERILFEENGVGYSANEVDSYRQVLEKSLIYDRDEVLNASAFVPVNLDDNQFLQFRSGRTFSIGINCRDFPNSSSRPMLEKAIFSLMLNAQKTKTN